MTTPHRDGHRPLIVQKFGGTSVATPALIQQCARRIVDVLKKQRDTATVVVVSAMGHTTDQLLTLASEVSASPLKRELDQLLATGEQVAVSLMAMALESLGVPAVSLTGGQCGILTDDAHGRARIRSIEKARIDQILASGKVPVVAGFQGVTDAGEITTLGRGGSDTTAVALAAALKAVECRIYTDVEGVYTADPNVVRNARLRPWISYDEMMEAAALGAKVMHLRAVELGKEFSVPIRVLHSTRAGEGTLIGSATGRDGGESRSLVQSGRTPDSPSDIHELTGPFAGCVSSVALKTDIGRVTLLGLPNRPGLQDTIFRPIADAGISVDDIIQTETDPHCADLTFTVDDSDIREVEAILRSASIEIDGARLRSEAGFSKVSAIGGGMRTQSGVASTMFHALADARIEIANISTSEIRISCLVPSADGMSALRVVHDVFELGAESKARPDRGVTIEFPATPEVARV